ncbi:hypothetical protein K3495_g910 [Podosphaera aphanis]|nr:hypothetical protein K3495_g910 [Podosphaera aphanis]
MTSAISTRTELPTLHHLNDSQSQRILWLLEELSIDYDLKLYERDPKHHRAPPSLASVSPLGKSPILVSADQRTITESSAITAYLLKTYDIKNIFESNDWVRDEILTSFVGATLGPIMTVELLFDLAHKATPFPLSWLVGRIRKAMHNNFTGKELRKGLKWLQDELGTSEWFGGDKLSRADILVSWPLDIFVFRGWIDIQKDFPGLWAWRERVLERPAWKRGIEKGNGYNLSNW